jgi:sigma-B regulation protein RsbU (phosphoserine phosphatase)
MQMTELTKNKNEKVILDTLRIANSALKLKNLKLNSLLEITNAINNNFSKEQLLKIFEFVLRSQLNIGRMAFYTCDEEWRCSLRYGLDMRFEEEEAAIQVLLFKEVTEFTEERHACFDKFEVVIPVFHKSKPLAFLLLGDIREDLIDNTQTRHIPFIQTLANIITVAIENKKLAKDNLRQAAVRKELELASEMQAMLFPNALPKDDKIEIAAFYQPHQEIGGDYYDFVKLNDNEVALCMADVSGKGVSAALLMANFQANIRALFYHSSSLPEIITELNKRVNASAKGEKFITLFLAKYNFITRVMTYINAGQNPPLFLYDNTVSQLSVGCPGLGMLEEIRSIKEGIINVPAGAALICYTDGVTELENEESKEFGLSKLELILVEKQNSSMKELNDYVVTKLKKHKGSRGYVDDIALLSCRFL